MLNKENTAYGIDDALMAERLFITALINLALLHNWLKNPRFSIYTPYTPNSQAQAP